MLDRCGEVQGEGPDFHTEVLGVVLDQVGDVGAVEQGLAGDAADVDAHAAQLVPFHHCRAEPELGGADGADITAGTAADDDYVVVRHAVCLERKVSWAFPTTPW